jgi:PTH1 family peptidyl-tRNA hydrolase
MAEASTPPPYRLVAGLGNPGPRYDGTRHNAGFAVLDALAAKHGDGATGFKDDNRGPASVWRHIGVTYLKPFTYMNASGEAVRAWLDWLKLDASDLLVVVDDIALHLGDVRFRISGSSGGHNGLRSVESHLGTTRYARLRLGVGPMPPLWMSSDFVLGKFLAGEQHQARRLIDLGCEALWCCQTHGIQLAMNRYNGQAGGAAPPEGRPVDTSEPAQEDT